MELFTIVAVGLLIILAVGDLFAGVVNDAVNFLNSAIGSRAGTRKAILAVAAVGVIIGATFSDGIIEVARKGIFNPELFSSSEAIMLFAAVALADILLLDLYSTYGLPTSTTVAIVFELLGAAFVLALWKLGSFENAWAVINGSSALRIIVGILISIAISFTLGLVVQSLTRLLFTFNFASRIKKFGFLWCGIALSALTYFMIVKGARHASFMTPAIKTWFATNTVQVLLVSFVVFSTLSYILIKLRVNALRLIVLFGTGALAMAFAGNDLANFISVSVAGVHAFFGADLSGSLPTPTWVLLLAGLIMSFALFKSRKARTVSDTELRLASHTNHVSGKWKPNGFSKALTGMCSSVFSAVAAVIPAGIREKIAKRWHKEPESGDAPAYDLLRAAVNVMVAASVISYATSQKLPLSTTYVTFMVAMGTSLADRAWGRDCAPCRIAGVMIVIGGWFLTAIIAMMLAGAVVTVLWFGGTFGLIVSMLFIVLSLLRLHHTHAKRTVEAHAFA